MNKQDALQEIELMPSNAGITSYTNDPVYRSALRHFQTGNWEKGLTELNQLVDSYSLDHNLRTLRQEMMLRSRIDKDEKEDLKVARRHQFRRLAVRLSTVVLVFTILFAGIQAYSHWFGQQWARASQRLDQEMHVIELAAKFRDAQDLQQAGRSADALKLFEEIAAVNPNYPQLSTYLVQSKHMAEVEARYDQAIQLLNLNDLPAALAIFKEIEAQERFYRDISLRIAAIELQQKMDGMLASADQAYQAADWQTAIAAYEDIRKLDPLFQRENVEDRLYESYVTGAQAILVEQSDSMEALETAQSYFQKALAIRPLDQEVKVEQESASQNVEDRLVQSYIEAAQSALVGQSDSLEALQVAQDYLSKALQIKPEDPEVVLELSLAKMYLRAQDEFSTGQWSEAISDLEYVYSLDMSYAMGTSRQTLYESYLARGDSYMARGEYEAALSDFQRAAELAEQDPDSTLRLFEAKVKVAEAQGVLGNYEESVLLYRDAIDLGGLYDRAGSNQVFFITALQKADNYGDQGNYRMAFREYREALRSANQTYETVTHVVKSGEYLNLIASRYHSTVQAIVEANDIANPNKIVTGQELLIPILP